MKRSSYVLALALATLAACADQPDPIAPYVAHLSAASAPGRAAESLYRIDALEAGTPWGEIGFPDVLVEIDGRFYVPRLAVIETARENRKVAKLLEAGQACWLGAHRNAESSLWEWVLPGGVWDASTYTNWSKAEPRDRSDDEPNPAGSVLAVDAQGGWHAVPDGTGTCMVVELVPVPED